jgi:hypothetical protein
LESNPTVVPSRFSITFIDGEEMSTTSLCSAGERNLAARYQNTFSRAHTLDKERPLDLLLAERQEYRALWAATISTWIPRKT